MQYSPKLKKAMEEIKAIIEREDIAATVVLHDILRGGNATDSKGFSETYVKINPTYSCAFFKNDEQGRRMVRFRSKLVDYNGDQDAQRRNQADTANMLMHLAKGSGDHAINFLDLLDVVDDKIAISEDDDESGFTSHEQQNN